MEATSQNASDSSDISALNRSRCLSSLQLCLPSHPPALHPSLSVSPSISSDSPPFSPNSDLPPPQPPSQLLSRPRSFPLHRHSVSPFPCLFKHSSGGFSTSMSSYLSFPLCIPGGGGVCMCMCVWSIKKFRQSNSCWRPCTAEAVSSPGLIWVFFCRSTGWFCCLFLLD